MLLILLTVVTVFVLLIINELWWRVRTVHDEINRKFVHVTVGTFVAFWPFFLSWQQIEGLSLAFVIVVGVSKHFKVFQAIHSVQRPTWGEMFFALAVGLVALVTHDKWIYVAALLQMSLADGFAAIIGTRYGNPFKYLVFKQTKSAAGTLTFFFISMAILLAFNHWGDKSLGLAHLTVIGAVATALENLGALGLDNLLVPLSVALLLAA